MKDKMIGIIILAILIVIILMNIGWVIGVYNTIVNAKMDIKGMWADLYAEYQRRLDLLGNLVKSVKSYKGFEKNTMVELAQARAGLKQAESNEEVKQAITKIENVGMKIQAQFEAYPDLKAMPLYKNLNLNILETENRINQARGELNNMVEDYNTYINFFPTNIIAKNVFGNKEEQFWKPDTDEAKADSYSIDM